MKNRKKIKIVVKRHEKINQYTIFLGTQKKMFMLALPYRLDMYDELFIKETIKDILNIYYLLTLNKK